jgi:hypothetical protein
VAAGRVTWPQELQVLVQAHPAQQLAASLQTHLPALSLEAGVSEAATRAVSLVVSLVVSWEESCSSVMDFTVWPALIPARIGYAWLH